MQVKYPAAPFSEDSIPPAVALDHYVRLRESDGWKLLMHRIGVKYERALMSRMLEPVTLENREEFNIKNVEARAVFSIIQQLDDEIAKLQKTIKGI
jgi:hypothetical protein